MTESSTTHEAPSELSAETLDFHRAYRSLIEELDAVDWYSQRIEAASDASLAAILAHNRDEEKEHAAMVLEWLRRHDSGWDAMLRAYLFTEGPIEALEALEEAVEAADRDDPPAEGELGIGSLRAGPADSGFRS